MGPGPYEAPCPTAPPVAARGRRARSFPPSLPRVVRGACRGRSGSARPPHEPAARCRAHPARHVRAVTVHDRPSLRTGHVVMGPVMAGHLTGRVTSCWRRCHAQCHGTGSMMAPGRAMSCRVTDRSRCRPSAKGPGGARVPLEALHGLPVLPGLPGQRVALPPQRRQRPLVLLPPDHWNEFGPACTVQ
jgi:hypothetical protein